MLKRFRFPALLLTACLAISISCSSCKSPNLEPGGTYAQTNELGAIVQNDTGLFVADAAYKFAYESVLSVMRFERNNRADLARLSPAVGAKVKAELDKIRPEVVTIDKRWAEARKTYRANPTPAGLSKLGTILAELQRLIPVVQQQIVPVSTVLTTPIP